MRLVLSSSLSGSWGFDSMEVLLIESSIFIDAMFPVVFLEVEVIVENVLATNHFALLPVSFVVASLRQQKLTFG